MTLGTNLQAIQTGPPNEDDLNLHIGRRLRRRRRLLGLTQQMLGDGIGLKFQQIQKYECGANRISAARLFGLAAALKVPVQYFFDGLLSEASRSAPANDRDRLDPEEMLSSVEARDLMDAYFRLPGQARQKLLDLVKALGNA